MKDRKEIGRSILRDPFTNKGLAFSKKEREKFFLEGLIPDYFSSLDEQIKIAYVNFCNKKEETEKYDFLLEMQNSNIVLFYRFVLLHVKEVLPIIYTPTVGEISKEYAFHYRHSNTIFLSKHVNINAIIDNSLSKDISVVVVTDGERMLGLGDMGINSAVIPLGKSLLYTLFGGIHPKKVLPIMLDVGTTKEHFKSDFYIGQKEPRMVGEEYYQFLDKFVDSLSSKYPNIMLQWEDFSKINAGTILNRYKNKICSFNDDIQGTAAVCLAGILSAIKQKKSTLLEERICIFGSGSAGMGIANIVVDYIAHLGFPKSDGYKIVYIMDRNGLVHQGSKGISSEQAKFARSFQEVNNRENIFLEDVIKDFKISILIGVSAQTGAFNKSVVSAMRYNTDMPIIFPLSNPNSKSEASPQDIYNWTDNRAIVAMGSPYDKVMVNGKNKEVAQCNNVYIFPAIGLAVSALSIKSILQKHFLIAAETLSRHTDKDSLFPSLNSLRSVIKDIAISIGESSVEDNWLKIPFKGSVSQKIEEEIWFPEYLS